MIFEGADATGFEEEKCRYPRSSFMSMTTASIPHRLMVFITDSVLPDPQLAPNLKFIQFHWTGLDLLAAMGGATPEDEAACRHCEDAPSAAL